MAAILFLDHSKTEPFENRIEVDHSNTGHVRYSDPHCILLYDYSGDLNTGLVWFLNGKGVSYPRMVRMSCFWTVIQMSSGYQTEDIILYQTRKCHPNQKKSGLFTIQKPDTNKLRVMRT